MSTPSQSIVSRAQEVISVRDSRGRVLSLRRLDALRRLRLLKAAGPELSANDSWLNIAALACSVFEIDSVPRATPSNEPQIETLVAELGDEGLEAIANALTEHPQALSLFAGTPEGNAPGTPS